MVQREKKVSRATTMLAAIETLTASFPQVFLGTSADDLDCTPGFQQRVLHIQQPAEFIEDQAVLNCKPSKDVPGPLMWTSQPSVTNLGMWDFLLLSGHISYATAWP